MEHLILFSYILIFSTGGAGLLSVIILYPKVKDPLVRLAAFLQAFFMAALALVAIYFYLGNVLDLVGGGSGWLEILFGLFSSSMSIAIYLVLYRLLEKVFSSGERKLKRSKAAKLLIFLSIALVAVVFIGNLIASLTGQLTRTPMLVSLFSYIVLTLSVSVSGLCLYRAELKGHHSRVRFLIRGIGLVSMLYLPLSVLEFLLERVAGFAYHPLSLDYLFYLGLNVIMILSVIRAGIQQDDPGKSEGFDLSEDTALEYGLTGRERQMATLIARGLSNKEIASELKISAATVRTHIYNLYQKTGVQSRIELVNTIFRSSHT